MVFALKKSKKIEIFKFSGMVDVIHGKNRGNSEEQLLAGHFFA
jgi:hypothetical protein